jgi:hypothetical protein
MSLLPLVAAVSFFFCPPLSSTPYPPFADLLASMFLSLQPPHSSSLSVPPHLFSAFSVVLALLCVQIHTHTHTHMHISLNVYLYSTHTHTTTHTHTHTHTHTQEWQWAYQYAKQFTNSEAGTHPPTLLLSLAPSRALAPNSVSSVYGCLLGTNSQKVGSPVDFFGTAVQCTMVQ